MTVWAVYARVSTEEQAKFGASLASQVEAATGRAHSLGAAEVVTFVDEGVPGDILQRPGIARLREAIASRAIAGLVVYDPDRLARNLAHQLLLTEEIQTAGIKLEFVNFEWKDTDEGRLFYAIRGAIAEYEKAKIRERTSRGKWTKVKQGYSPNGRVPYGYVFDKPSRMISVSAEAARWVKQIYAWIVHDNLGPQRVANRLNALSVPPPQRARQWGASSVRHIVKNSAYKGRQVVHRYNTEGTHKNRHLPKEQRKPVLMRAPEDWLTIPIPQLIDEQTWDAAQASMADLRQKHAGRPGKHFFLLQRVAGVRHLRRVALWREGKPGAQQPVLPVHEPCESPPGEVQPPPHARRPDGGHHLGAGRRVGHRARPPRSGGHSRGTGAPTRERRSATIRSDRRRPQPSAKSARSRAAGAVSALRPGGWRPGQAGARERGPPCAEPESRESGAADRTGGPGSSDQPWLEPRGLPAAHPG